MSRWVWDLNWTWCFVAVFFSPYPMTKRKKKLKRSIWPRKTTHAHAQHDTHARTTWHTRTHTHSHLCHIATFELTWMLVYIKSTPALEQHVTIRSSPSLAWPDQLQSTMHASIVSPKYYIIGASPEMCITGSFLNKKLTKLLNQHYSSDSVIGL